MKNLNLKPENKVLFFQNEKGEIVVANASAQATYKAQSLFANVADEIGVKNEYDFKNLLIK